MKSLKKLTVLAGLVLLLTGCGQAAAPVESTAASEVHVPSSAASSQTEQQPEQAARIGESISEDGEYLDQYGEKRPYSYHVPQILSDTPAARSINERIEQQVGGYARQLLQAIQAGGTVYDDNITWESFWQDEMVTLMVRTGDEAAVGQYLTFHYDFADDTAPDNRELVRRLGVSEEDFMDSMRCSVMSGYDATFEGMPMDDWYSRNYYDRALMMRMQTLQDIDLETAILCPYDGGCGIIAKYYTLADAERWYNAWSYHYCELDLTPLDQPGEVRVTDGKITAVLDNNKVRLRFEDDEELTGYLYHSVDPLPGAALKPGRDYEIEGLHLDYVDMMLGNMGNSYAPYLALLTRQGTVELVNVMDCLCYAQFCGYPAYGLSGIESLKTCQSVSGHSIRAVDMEGNEYNLADWAFAVQDSVPRPMADGIRYESGPVKHRTAGGSYESTYALTFGEDQSHLLVLEEDLPDAGVKLRQEGTYQLLGMTDEGLVYQYTIRDPENPAAGTLCLRPALGEDGTGYENTAIQVKINSGPDLLDRGQEWTRFEAGAVG